MDAPDRRLQRWLWSAPSRAHVDRLARSIAASMEHGRWYYVESTLTLGSMDKASPAAYRVAPGWGEAPEPVLIRRCLVTEHELVVCGRVPHRLTPMLRTAPNRRERRAFVAEAAQLQAAIVAGAFDVHVDMCALPAEPRVRIRGGHPQWWAMVMTPLSSEERRALRHRLDALHRLELALRVSR
jgi:hypothetical protein